MKLSCYATWKRVISEFKAGAKCKVFFSEKQFLPYHEIKVIQFKMFSSWDDGIQQSMDILKGFTAMTSRGVVEF